MNNIQSKFIEIMFEPSESVCVSPNTYAYKSLAIKTLKEKNSIVLEGNTNNQSGISCQVSDLRLISLNPIQGKRLDDNVTVFRSFLIEIDKGRLSEQLNYINNVIKMPYSACVFSGNKSLHFLITLSEPYTNLQNWKFVNQWILNIAQNADQQTKNPSRCIRFPDNKRENGIVQKLIKLNSRIDKCDLNIWINKFPECRPASLQNKKRSSNKFRQQCTRRIPAWIRVQLKEGISSEACQNRNQTWFNISCILFENGFSLDEVVDYLETGFIEEHDFKKSEWLNTIKSAYERINRKLEEL